MRCSPTPVLSFRETFRFKGDDEVRFKGDDEVLTSDTTLRFRSQQEIAVSLADTGYSLLDASEAPDRPGRELVFIARRID